ncbi:MAG: MarC family protein [Halieaceae bacterium]|nr:MarC family protein [Halieaceae bacterium]MCP4465223.1 MarC family protein [Halieaceae bacterium]MCP4841908.1 MarC family protein [Halieaceae bacterium]MDG2410599.1 MarC family protein [Halioglobus sp.]
MIDLIAIFVLFFAVIDPIGTVPVFIAVTRHQNAAEKRRTALKATLVASVILVFFALAGEQILGSLDIPLSAFQISGGIILFLFALTMIFGESKPEEEVKLSGDAQDKSIFPLAVPSIASPGAMLAAVMQTENTMFSLPEQAQITGVMLLVLASALILMLASTYVHRIIGDSGASIISRIMGIILASMAVTSVLEGIVAYFGL